MNKNIKNFIFTFIFIFLFQGKIFAETKEYQISQDKLFIDTLAAIGSLKLNISEFNSSLGEIIYTSNNNEYFVKIYTADNISHLSIKVNKKNNSNDNSNYIIFNKLDEKYGTGTEK